MSSRLDATLLVDVKRPGSFVSKHIFGQFAEHLGRCIYGGFFVGEGSAVPNVKGIRKDVLSALTRIDIPNLRWPGGCFADTYHWKDGIGPKDSRPPIVNRWWGEVTEDNSFGTHEYLTLCELLNAQPFITANLGSGSVKELIDWVQYTNFEGVSPMSDLRRKNGRQEPWHVKYWGLGNEAWGCGGNMTASYYANVYRQYSTFMTGWSNNQNLFRIASGPNTADLHWTETLMREIPFGLMEGIGLHYYAVYDWQQRGRATEFTDIDYYRTVVAALRMQQLLYDHISIMDRYDPLGNIALVVDEWGTWYDVEHGTNPGFLYQQNTMRDAIVAAITLNIFVNYAARVRMANIAQTVNVLQALIYTDDKHFWLSPTYHVFDLYKHHHDAQLLPVEITSKDFKHEEMTFPTVSAAATVNGRGEVSVTLVNTHLTDSVTTRMDLSADVVMAKCEVLTSASISDHNSKEDPSRVQPKSWTLEIEDGRVKIELPKHSVTVCVFQLK